MKIKILKLIDIFIGKLLCLFLGYLDYLFNLTSKDITIPQPHKILFIRPGGIGDFLYLLPTILLVKKHYPEATVHILAEKRNKGVENLTDTFDKIICYDTNPFKTITSLLSENYDIVIDSEQFHNFSAVFAYLTHAKVRIGFNTNPFRNHLYTHLINYSLDGKEAGEFLKLLQPLGITEKAFFEGFFSYEKIRRVPFPSEFVNLKIRFNSIVIVAPRGEAKYRHWTPEKYRRLIQHLTKDKNQAIIIIGSKKERKIEKLIMDRISDPNAQVLSLIGKTSLLELSRIILESDLFVGCDCGVAILAALLGIKSVTIFGSANENKWGLKNEKHFIVRKKLPCAPCQMLGNYKFCKHIECMERIEVEDIIQAINELLKEDKVSD